MIFDSVCSSHLTKMSKMSSKTSATWTLMRSSSSIASLKPVQMPRKVRIRVMMKLMQRRQRKPTITKRTSSTKRTTTCIEVSCKSTRGNMRKLLETSIRALRSCMPTKCFTLGTNSLMKMTYRVPMIMLAM